MTSSKRPIKKGLTKATIIVGKKLTMKLGSIILIKSQHLIKDIRATQKGNTIQVT
jgi:hypothetical protein